MGAHALLLLFQTLPPIGGPIGGFFVQVVGSEDRKRQRDMYIYIYNVYTLKGSIYIYVYIIYIYYLYYLYTCIDTINIYTDIKYTYMGKL